ncbi:small GTP-binding domain protein [Nitzschia inconspicua]|uniref:Small GTP-binding domain protein n=1 Tax=Nitzschia inconspicua TaxID=303405 RepID=A0A9K3LUU4_9STRA|nr:small GTP-binding domain protein [Nitzschia inconspicua]KAG7368482.1 small GTP-binding domain protein [Nitzschia inconspicua]
MSGGGNSSGSSSIPANNNTINLHHHNSNNQPTVVHRKVAVLGYRAVGKTSLVNIFVTGSFSEQYEPTIESSWTKTIRFRKVHFATDIVDTAGMDEFSRLSRNASLGVHGYLLVFSISNRQSFEMIQQVNDVLLNSLGDLPDVPRVLVGTMKDRQESRQVSLADAQKLADLWKVPYIECSNKTGESVAETFHTLLKEIEKDDGLLAETGEVGCSVQ